AVRRVEALDGLHQAQHADLVEVVHGLAPVAVAARLTADQGRVQPYQLVTDPGAGFPVPLVGGQRGQQPLRLPGAVRVVRGGSDRPAATLGWAAAARRRAVGGHVDLLVAGLFRQDRSGRAPPLIGPVGPLPVRAGPAERTRPPYSDLPSPCPPHQVTNTSHEEA